jgi:hypothetical protein
MIYITSTRRGSYPPCACLSFTRITAFVERRRRVYSGFVGGRRRYESVQNVERRSNADAVMSRDGMRRATGSGRQ